MQKNNREKEWKATAKNNNINKIKNDADIANLNTDESFAPIEEKEEKKPLTEEEKIEVRKKLFILLILIILALLFMLVMLIFDPFNSSAKKEKKEEVSTPVSDEDKKNDSEEQTIYQLKDGPVPNTNKELNKLIKEIIYNDYENMENDTLALYRKNSILINDLNDKYKLFLVSKTSEFKELVTEQNKDNNLCNNDITISIVDISKILSKKFNTTVKKYDEFSYSYYDNDTFVANIKFTLNGDNYIGKCYNSNTTPVSVVDQEYIDALKDEDLLYLNIRVAFINKTGVYKDPNFKTLITNNKMASKEEYIKNANTYSYVYVYDNDHYYLQKVELLK